MRKLSGVIVLSLGLLAWCGSAARAQEGMGGLKGLPGQMQKDVGAAVQQEIGGATGQAAAPAAAPADAAAQKAGAADAGAQNAGAVKDAPAKAADDSGAGAGMKGGGDGGGDGDADDTK